MRSKLYSPHLVLTSSACVAFGERDASCHRLQDGSMPCLVAITVMTTAFGCHPPRQASDSPRHVQQHEARLDELCSSAHLFTL